MRPLSRRDLLRGGVAMGAAAVTHAKLPRGSEARRSASSSPVPLRRPDSLPFPHMAAGTDTLPEVEHIVVLMMENHSYDNYLGLLRRGDGFTLGPGGAPVETNPYANGDRQRAFSMPTTCQLDAKPSQEWQASHQQFNNGKNDGFVISPSGPVAMGYWGPTDLPFYYSLASTFPLGDRWFCSLLGQTNPNRRYLIAATSAGVVDDDVAQLTIPAPNGTIFDRLEHFGISWRDYYHPSSSPTVGVYLSDPAATSPNVIAVDAFFNDVAAGTLPDFCIVDPNFGTGSEEDPQDISVGQAFAAQVINALMDSPSWQNTILVWTYDEHGGYYDHVPPPPAIAPDTIQPLVLDGESTYDGFHRYGFRVPAAVISPFARANHVSSLVYDHTSILALVERKWNLPALTYRDANAHDLMDFLDFQHPGFRDPPRLAKPLKWPQACETTGPGTIPPPDSIIPKGSKSHAGRAS